MIKGRDTIIGYHCPNCGMSILNKINIFTMDGSLVKIKCVCSGSELIVQALKNNKFRLVVPCILCPNSHSFTLSSGAFFQKDLFAFTCKFTAINICYIGGSNKVFDALKKNEEELMKTFAAYEEDYDGGGDYDAGELESYYGLSNINNINNNGINIPGESGDSGFFGIPDGPEGFSGLGAFEDLFGLRPEEREPEFKLHRKNPENDNPPGVVKPDVSDNNNNDINNNGEWQIPFHIRAYQITGQTLDSLSRLCEKRAIFCKCGVFEGKIILAGNAVHIECKNCGSYRDIKTSNSADADYLSESDSLYLDYDE
ncbi:MAG: hypothetical protein FWH10_07300 [Oscillospiraceae bacterium]|nr:hypothetical protein [Oscillospiraceae bacterium]